MSKRKITRQIANAEINEEHVCEVIYEQKSFDSNWEWQEQKRERFVVRVSHARKAAYMCNTLDMKAIARYCARWTIVGEDDDYFRIIRVENVKES